MTLKRTKPLRARKPPKRVRPITKVNRARRAKRSLEQYGTKEFREWIHAQLCVIPWAQRPGDGPIEQVHVKSRGAGGTWRDTVPMRRCYHRELHDVGVEEFQRRYGVNLGVEARVTQKHWLAHLKGNPPMTSYRFSAYGVPGSLKAQVYLDDKLLATMTGLQDTESVERWARSVLKAQEPKVKEGRLR